jgi:hypothetical protein
MPDATPQAACLLHSICDICDGARMCSPSPACHGFVNALSFSFLSIVHSPFPSAALARADDARPVFCRPREGWAERREAPALNGRARRARRHACEAWAVPRNRDAASRRSTVALSAQGPLPSPALPPAPVRRLDAAGQTCPAAAPGVSYPRLRAAVDATPRSAVRIVSGDAPHERG